jgi:hypothetical protein
MKLVLKVVLSTIVVMIMAPQLSRLESFVVVWLLALLAYIDEAWGGYRK